MEEKDKIPVTKKIDKTAIVSLICTFILVILTVAAFFVGHDAKEQFMKAETGQTVATEQSAG